MRVTHSDRPWPTAQCRDLRYVKGFVNTITSPLTRACLVRGVTTRRVLKNVPLRPKSGGRPHFGTLEGRKVGHDLRLWAPGGMLGPPCEFTAPFSNLSHKPVCHFDGTVIEQHNVRKTSGLPFVRGTEPEFWPILPRPTIRTSNHILPRTERQLDRASYALLVAARFVMAAR